MRIKVIGATEDGRDGILTKSEIEDLNKEKGYNLSTDEKSMYVIKFLYNDKLNKSTDPAPFKISTDILDKIAKKAIGMPWIIPPKLQDKPEHLRGTHEGKPDTAKALLEIQNEYAVGSIAATLRNEDSNNVYGIINVWPDYQNLVNSSTISPHTSITLGNPVFAPDKQTVTDAEFLNLQTVGSGAYEPRLTSMQGVCTNGLKQCMSELQVLGAAGQLKASRKQRISFSNRFANVIGAMSAEEPTAGSDQPSNADIIKAVEEVKAEVETVKQMEEKLAEVVVEVATEAEGVDETKIKEALGKGGEGGSSDSAPEVAGAAGNQKLVANEVTKTIKQLKKEYDAKFALIEKERDDALKKTRLVEAESIVDRKIALGKIKRDERDAKIKSYFELKDEEGRLQNLSLIASELKDLVPDTTKTEEVLGAAGSRSNFPDFTLGDNDSTNAVSSHLLRRIGGNAL